MGSTLDELRFLDDDMLGFGSSVHPDSPYKLLAIDLDGTLLGRDGVPHAADRAAVARLRAAGIPTTICTGRLYSGSRDIARTMGIEGPIACVDGAPQSATGSSLDQLRGPLRPTALACDGVDAFDWAAGWHSANQGNCDTFTRVNGDDQHFEGDDLIAYAGHVVAISGSVFWDIRLQNWGASGWYWGLQSYAIPQGTQAYWYMSRITNDFNLTTRVEVTSSSATFNHDFARCHDYRHRVVNAGSSVYGGCKINLNGTQVHVNDLNFVASDPSNIPTVIPW